MEYGIDPRNLDMVAYAKEYKFIDGGKEHSSQFIHSAIMDMNYYHPDGYFYRVGCNITMSDLYTFRSFPLADDPAFDNWSPHIAIYGDMGNSNAQSLPRLQRYFSSA